VQLVYKVQLVQLARKERPVRQGLLARKALLEHQ
jgi:hypothetical protein